MTSSEKHNKGTGLLDGVRVLDMTTIILGPVAGMLLGDLGADVIKLEPPGGDPARGIGPQPTDGMGAVFLTINRNKRSIELDLKSEKGQRKFKKLLKSVDVFIHNMRPQAAARLGLTYDQLKVERPDLIYCAAYGYQADGPYGNKAAYDDMIQAASGLTTIQAEEGEAPVFVKQLLGDKITGIYTALAVGMALYYREKTGLGQDIEVPMFETLTSFNAMEHLFGLTHIPQKGPEGYTRARSKQRRPHATRDGFIAVLPYVDKQWRSFFEIAGKPEMMNDPVFESYDARLKNIDEVYERMGALVKLKTTEEWLSALDEKSVPAMRVNSLTDLVDDPHLEATGFWQLWEDERLGTLRMPSFPINFSKATHKIYRRAPYLGEHNEELLGGL